MNSALAELFPVHNEAAAKKRSLTSFGLLTPSPLAASGRSIRSQDQLRTTKKLFSTPLSDAQLATAPTSHDWSPAPASAPRSFGCVEDQPELAAVKRLWEPCHEFKEPVHQKDSPSKDPDSQADDESSLRPKVEAVDRPVALTSACSFSEIVYQNTPISEMALETGPVEGEQHIDIVSPEFSIPSPPPTDAAFDDLDISHHSEEEEEQGCLTRPSSLPEIHDQVLDRSLPPPLPFSTCSQDIFPSEDLPVASDTWQMGSHGSDNHVPDDAFQDEVDGSEADQDELGPSNQPEADANHLVQMPHRDQADSFSDYWRDRYNAPEEDVEESEGDGGDEPERQDLDHDQWNSNYEYGSPENFDRSQVISGGGLGCRSHSELDDDYSNISLSASLIGSGHPSAASIPLQKKKVIDLTHDGDDDEDEEGESFENTIEVVPEPRRSQPRSCQNPAVFSQQSIMFQPSLSMRPPADSEHSLARQIASQRKRRFEKQVVPPEQAAPPAPSKKRPAKRKVAGCNTKAEVAAKKQKKKNYFSSRGRFRRFRGRGGKRAVSGARAASASASASKSASKTIRAPMDRKSILEIQRKMNIQM